MVEYTGRDAKRGAVFKLHPCRGIIFRDALEQEKIRVTVLEKLRRESLWFDQKVLEIAVGQREGDPQRIYLTSVVWGQKILKS